MKYGQSKTFKAMCFIFLFFQTFSKANIRQAFNHDLLVLLLFVVIIIIIKLLLKNK